MKDANGQGIVQDGTQGLGRLELATQVFYVVVPLETDDSRCSLRMIQARYLPMN